MKKVEAVEALLGSDPSLANEEAVRTLDGDLSLSATEVGQLEAETADRLTAFTSDPQFFIDDDFKSDPRRPLLQRLKTAMDAKKSVAAAPAATPVAAPSTPAAPPVAAPAATAAAAPSGGTVLDPSNVAALAAAAAAAKPSVPRSVPSRASASASPSAAAPAPPAADDGRGKGKKDRRDRREESGTGDSAEPAAPPPPPKRPGSIVPIEWHDARKLTQWPPLRDQLIAAARETRNADNAVRVPATTRLEKLRGVVELYYGQGPQLRIMAIMARRLIEDLRDQLDLKDPDEFRARYDVF